MLTLNLERVNRASGLKGHAFKLKLEPVLTCISELVDVKLELWTLNFEPLRFEVQVQFFSQILLLHKALQNH